MARLTAKTCVLLAPALALLGGCVVSPEPLNDAQLMGLTQSRIEAVPQLEPGRVVTLSLYDALARALKNNFDHHVEAMQVALRTAETRQIAASGLPSLVASAGYTSRSNDMATGNQLLEPLPPPLPSEFEADSVKQERELNTHDLSLSWNILDFALSYTRTHQAADKQLIADQQRRRIVQRLIEDTRAAYWRTLSFERMAQKLERLDERAKRAISRTKAAARDGAETPMTALSYERELTQIRQTAEKLRHELSLAKAQLAALMNVPPGTQFKLVDSMEQPDPPVGHLSAGAMIIEAVFNRPEIREIAYQQRINEREVAAAFFEALPGLRLHATSSFSDDHFLLNNDWTAVGTAAAGNLLKLVQLPARQRVIEAEAELLRAKALATTMVVITQVHVSRIRHYHNHDLLKTAREYLDVQSRLVRHIRAEKDADLVGEQTLIREEMNLLVAEVQNDIAIGNVLSSSSNLMTTLGYDLQGQDLDLSQDLKVIAGQIRTNWSNRAAVSERALYQHEIEKARNEAKRRAEEEDRRRRAEAARAKAEQARIASLAADEAAKARKAEAARLKADAEKARTQARMARKTGGKMRSQAQPAETRWEWVWPQVPSTPSEPERRQKTPKIYTGTK